LFDGYYMSSLPAGTDILDALRGVGADIMERHLWTYSSSLSPPRGPEATQDIKGLEYETEGIRITLHREEHAKGHLITKSYQIPGRTITERGLLTFDSPGCPNREHRGATRGVRGVRTAHERVRR